ncbi:MAG: GHKL domain-containing protein [Leptospira sp.]|nr:GHKL domain-containing protein [Leptospira sp.]NCS95064.1 GHKL domain-containing protein [Leptospira sp.]
MISKLKKITFSYETEFLAFMLSLATALNLLVYFVTNSRHGLLIGSILTILFAYGVIKFRNNKKAVQVDKLLQRSYRKADIMEYLTSLDEFKSALISINEPVAVCEKITNYIKHSLNASQARIYLWEEQSGAFHPKPFPEDSEDHFFFYVYDPFVLWLSDNPRLLIPSDLETVLDHLPLTLDKAKEFFEKTNAYIIVPLVLNSGLLGILTIAKKASEDGIYSLDDIEKLSEIVEVSTLSLSNASFYNQLISMTENLEAKVKERTRELEETQSQLVMSEKMASLGVMVAGIAHEINTPAGVINAASDNLEDNMLYTYLHVNDLQPHLNNIIVRRSFRKLLVKLLRETQRKRIDPSQKFKIKKEIKESMLKLGVNETDANDGSQFIVDNNILDLIEDVAKLYKNKAHSVMEILKNGVGAARNIKNIKYSIQNVVRIVKALKYYSHLDQSSYGEADITEGIENTLVILHNQIKQGIDIQRDYSSIPKVYCNIDELNQVWTNLINNAIHALKKTKDPLIRITTTVKELAGNPYVVVSFSDNGTGITKEIKDRIWDPFFTTKDQGEGSGLGLGIVKGIIEKHKGTIKVDSEVGRTEFNIFLPVEKPKFD